MLFRDHPVPMAISQPMHAWISGQILRAWAGTLDEPLLLAAEQHDIGWLDWETSPVFDPVAGRPYLFRDVGATVHAPMWSVGVNRALHAWGRHVALLISRHGCVIYRRFTDRHRTDPQDAAAAQNFLDVQQPAEREWALALRLDQATLDRQTALVAFADTLSLALCGELGTPLTLEAPDRTGALRTFRLTNEDGSALTFMLDPWPFRDGDLIVEGHALVLPGDGRFHDEDAMRTWFRTADQAIFKVRISPG